MPFISLAVDNETPPKVNNRPRVGVKHGAPAEAAALRLLRSAARATRTQVNAQAVVQRLEAERFAGMVIDCANELDQSSLLVLEHMLRALWISSNPRSKRPT
jgi:hypothetical protein